MVRLPSHSGSRSETRDACNATRLDKLRRSRFDWRSTQTDEMPPYDDWNKVDDDEEEELFDPSVSGLLVRNSTVKFVIL